MAKTTENNPSNKRTSCKRGTPKGVNLLREPFLNKDTAFTEQERDSCGIRGFLPPYVLSQDEQVKRVMENYHKRATPFEKHIYLRSIQDSNEDLFYRVVMDNVTEMMPLIYTPVVGQACQEFSHIFEKPRGLFITPKDKGKIADILRTWPQKDVRIIVVTDGERILGLGDQGADGMGIPIGKLSLYIACAGINPAQCLPVTLDVGTNSEAKLNDPLYIGIREKRLRGQAYDDLVEEFIVATQEVFPEPLIQFEDFGNTNAFRLLTKYRDRICTFNDDIQGTGSVIVSGLYSAMRITGGKLEKQKILFQGAGEAGTGIADLIVAAMIEEGLSEEKARQQCWFVDSKGLVIKSRTDLAEHKLPYAHEHKPVTDFLSAVEALKPTVIIGASAQPKTFTQSIIEAVSKINERPIVFAISNPTSKAECTAEEAYKWSKGRAVFASGSPFDPVTLNGKTFVPGQGNNAYIFPGVGMGAIACGAKRVTDEMFSAAAKALAGEVAESDLEKGRIYPPLSMIRHLSAVVATATAEVAFKRGLTKKRKPADIVAFMKSQMYDPKY
ncbi:MAG: NAD-dependent malic enzyme [Dehalococcoidia bacterium]|nr:NAD-dependent malic enzyme [Dehalococcoidia bacterium]